jgi:SAM-dependent methyltransferase
MFDTRPEPDERLVRLLGYANPFAQSAPLLPPICQASALDVRQSALYRHILASSGLDDDTLDLPGRLARDTGPIPHPDNREGYNGDHHLAYWLTGLRLFLQISEVAAQHGIDAGSLLDFGGSTGRVFRHFAYQSDAWQVWSCDFKMSSVQWNLAHFPSNIRCFQNMYFPLLPLEDRQFDLVTAFSVFTHIDETETPWLLELRRILRPGGLALITIHDETTWRHMHEELRRKIRKYRPDLAGLADMPDGRHVSTWRTDDPYRCDVFHSASYINTNWARYFTVEAILPRFCGLQSAVILRKP